MIRAQAAKSRPDATFPQPRPLREEELENPTAGTVLKLVYNAFTRIFHDPVGMVIGSTFLLLILWGYHGRLEIFEVIWKGWKGPGSDVASRARIIPGIPWDQEWISFGAGFVLLVVIPCLIIRFVFKQRLQDYGLGLPAKGRWRLTVLSAVMLFCISVFAFALGAGNGDMQKTYPLFRGQLSAHDFLVYEAGYFVFFVVIEFVFRGFLLFGLFHLRDANAPPGVRGEPGPLVFGYYAIIVSMLSYTAWHLGKPLPEVWGTLFWGLAAGGIALATGTIWHIVMVHYALNVFLDYRIWSLAARS